MDAGPEAVQPFTLEDELGPISPELVLVDPVFAERARELLPATPWLPTPRAPVAAADPPAPPNTEPTPESAAAEAPAPSPTRRLRRSFVLALLVFAAGAASGGFLSRQDAATPEATFAGQTPQPMTPGPATPAPSKAGKASLEHQASTSGKPEGRRRSSARAHRPQGRSRTSWAANVLGVAARVDGSGVTLVWQRPASSARVVVLRALGSRRATVVYRARSTSFHDRSARPCSAYRYTIVNYDKRGHRSTGVPSSVVTDGCT